MLARKLRFLPLLLLSLGMTSCVQNTPKSYAALNGNWHLSGQQGATQLPLLKSPLLTFAMGVSGKTVSANGTAGVNCSGGDGALAGSMSFSGQIAADGTFELTNSAEPRDTIQLTIKGKVPPDGATTWAGSYTMVNSTPPTGCIFNLSSDFVATAYPPLNGTYSGKITGHGLGSGIMDSTVISQGAITAAPLRPSLPVIYYIPLRATIEVSGSSSYSSGTTTASQSAAASSSVSGNSLSLNYLMNDGSTVLLEGWFPNPSESTLQVHLMPGFGTSGSVSDICTLTRQ